VGFELEMPVAFGVALLRAEVRTGAVGNLDFEPCARGFLTLEASGRGNIGAGATLGSKERASWKPPKVRVLRLELHQEDLR
jgi:hypothetical protein